MIVKTWQNLPLSSPYLVRKQPCESVINEKMYDKTDLRRPSFDSDITDRLPIFDRKRTGKTDPPPTVF